MSDPKPMTNEEMMAKIAELTAQNEALKAGAIAKTQFKVSEKGALSLYGMGRFPVTLYKGQWMTVLALAKDGQLEKALSLPGLKNKEDETEAEATARKARVEAYSAQAKAAQGTVNEAKATAAAAVAPVIRKAQ